MFDSLRTTSLLLSLALVMTATAGCFAEDADPSTTSGTATDATETAGSTNASLNSPPVVDVQVLSNGTELDLSNGSYPVAVGDNVTFDASGSSDPDGDNVSFSWDFGDGNTSTEAMAVYAYGAAGNYTVTLEVDDGNGGTATASLNLTVESAGPAPGTILREEKKTYTGTYTVGVQGTSCVNNVQGSAASKANEFIVPATDGGANVGASKFVITLKGGTTSIDQAYRFTGPDGKIIGDRDDGSTGPNGGEGPMTYEGDFKPGKYTVTVYGCVAVNGSWTLDVVATLVAV